MSEAAAIATQSTAPPPHAAARRLREIDLYAEGNSFAESEGSDQAITDWFGKDGFGFRDMLDIINPLHHLPVVGTLYRAFTGDELAPGARLLGGTLFGGIGGFVTALANAVVENETGSDIGDKVLAFFQDDVPQHQNLAATSEIPTSNAPAVKTAAAQLPSPPPEPRTIPIFAGPPQALVRPPAGIDAGGKPAASRDDPTEALIRARAVVPASRRSGIAGLPLERKASPRAAADSAAVLAAGAAAPQATPASMTVAKPAPTPTAGDAASPAAPPADVAVLMREALDKYQALMKRRASPSISGDY